MSRDWKIARRKVDSEGFCRVCGAAFNVEAAHIVPRSLGGEQAADSIVPLCQPCHSSFDDHDLDLLGYLTHEEQAEAVRVLGLEAARNRLMPSESPKRHSNRKAA